MGGRTSSSFSVLACTAAFLLNALPALAGPVAGAPPSGFSVVDPFSLDGVQLAARHVNVSKGGPLEVGYYVDRSASVSLTVYSLDFEAVGTSESKVEAGRRSATWDGLGKDGEARCGLHYYTLRAKDEAGESVECNPLNAHEPQSVHFENVAIVPSPDGSYQVSYDLAQDAWARELLFMGPDAVLVRTFADWSGLKAGHQSFHWDGWDDSKGYRWKSGEGLKLSVFAYSLPSNAFLLECDGEDPHRPTPPLRAPQDYWPPNREKASVLSDWHHDRRYNRNVRPSIVLEKAHDSYHNCDPSRFALGIRLAPADSWFAIRERFEIMLYADGQFLGEEESGRAPYSWLLPRSLVGPGGTLMSVKLGGYKGHFGAAHILVTPGMIPPCPDKGKSGD